MKLFAIPNLSASAASECQPWETEPAPEDFPDKQSFVDWCQHPATRHCHYSSFEGLVPSLRVSAGANDPFRLHGFVVDYDTKIGDDMLDTLKERNKTEFMPVWLTSTCSGGCRLIWDFEEPLLLSSNECTVEFLKIAATKMGFRKLLPGFDEHFTNVQMYYERGRNWRRLSDDRIQAELLWQWMYEAGQKTDFSNKSDIVVPEQVLAKEVARKYPGRWPGTFELGARGPRFWDADAGNPTAAVVRERGMQCFTGTQGFVPWVDIFGHAFVEAHQAERAGAIVRNWFYDGKLFWQKAEPGWVSHNKEDFKLHMKAKHGLSSRAGKRENVSELERVMYEVLQSKRVTSVIPRVHHPEGVYLQNGERCLNTCTCRCIDPVDETGLEWGGKFPWLASLLNDFFDPPEQLEYFLGWLKWFYENGLRMDPRSGQALFIGGAKGKGKTLLSSEIIARLVGGHQPASDYLVEGRNQFNDFIVGTPLLTVDDASAATNARCHARFTAAVKALVANPYHSFNKKFGDAGLSKWLGRVIVTCNMDPESIRILPHVDVSNIEKTCFFKTSDTIPEFPDMLEIRRLVGEELPWFARWLLEWPMPPHVAGASRFGVKHYHEREMLDSAMLSETSHAFNELLEDFRRRWFNSTGQYAWVGTSTGLLSNLMAQPDYERIIRPFCDVRSVARNLSKLANRGDGIVTVAQRKGGRVWTINCDPDNMPEYMRDPNNSALSDVLDMDGATPLDDKMGGAE